MKRLTLLFALAVCSLLTLAAPSQAFFPFSAPRRNVQNNFFFNAPLPPVVVGSQQRFFQQSYYQSPGFGAQIDYGYSSSLYLQNNFIAPRAPVRVLLGFDRLGRPVYGLR